MEFRMSQELPQLETPSARGTGTEVEAATTSPTVSELLHRVTKAVRGDSQRDSVAYLHETEAPYGGE